MLGTENLGKPFTAQVADSDSSWTDFPVEFPIYRLFVILLHFLPSTPFEAFLALFPSSFFFWLFLLYLVLAIPISHAKAQGLYLLEYTTS
jgi:hypothetical protein